MNLKKLWRGKKFLQNFKNGDTAGCPAGERNVLKVLYLLLQTEARFLHLLHQKMSQYATAKRDLHEFDCRLWTPYTFVRILWYYVHWCNCKGNVSFKVTMRQHQLRAVWSKTGFFKTQGRLLRNCDFFRIQHFGQWNVQFWILHVASEFEGHFW